MTGRRRRGRGAWLLLAALVCLCGLPGPGRGVRADTLATDISSHLVQISSSFSGTSLLVFGAVEAEGPGRRDVVVVLRGPERPVTVRRKENRFGIWLNASATTYGGVPGFFAVATTRPLDQVAAPGELARHRLDIPYLRLEANSTTPDPAAEAEFRAALVRLKTKEGLYGAAALPVTFSAANLFRAEFRVPSNMPPGSYKVEAYLFRDGDLVAAQSSPLFVDKSGFERRLFTLSRQNPAIYALVAIVLAVAAGWLAAYVFRRP